MNGLYIPEALAADQSLNWNQKVVYGVYHYYTYYGQSHCCRLTNDTICKHLGLKERTLQRVKQELTNNGYITVNGITVKALKEFAGVTEMTPIANNEQKGDTFDTHSEQIAGVTEMTPIANNEQKGDTFDTHSEQIAGVTNMVEGVTKMVVRGDTFDTHNKENKNKYIKESKEVGIPISEDNDKLKTLTDMKTVKEFWTSWRKYKEAFSTLTNEDRNKYYDVYKSKLTNYYNGPLLEDKQAELKEEFDKLCNQTEEDFDIVRFTNGEVYRIKQDTNFKPLVEYSIDIPNMLGREVAAVQVVQDNLKNIKLSKYKDYFEAYVGYYIYQLLYYVCSLRPGKDEEYYTKWVIAKFNQCCYGYKIESINSVKAELTPKA